jgi:3-phosphoshikimate 1-carboxyvinyltransferase
MPIPELIEIVPLEKPIQAEITIPGSKSITNRALILAALAGGETTLRGALWSEDTQVMVEALGKLGFEVNVENDPLEFCNRTITVNGQGGKIPKAGTEAEPLEIFVGNAGTAARFLTALVCLGRGVYRLHGVARMHERPQRALFAALRELGYRIESANDKLPAVVLGAGPRKGKCVVSIEESSQFASALLLCARVGGWEIYVIGDNAEESPYVVMTSKLIESFPKSGGAFQIEPDASSGAYVLGASFLAEPFEYFEHSEQFGIPIATTMFLPFKVATWPTSGWQADAKFGDVIKRTPALALGLKGLKGTDSAWVTFKEGMRQAEMPMRSSIISRDKDLGDSIMMAAVLAPFAAEPVLLTDLGRLRLQETERVVALRTELTSCGAKVVEKGDTLEVFPSEVHGAEIETYNDHRMAMCFTVLGLKVPGIKIRNPTCVKKTFPNFFQKLATAPPHGLGATILDGKTGRKLGLVELFAD